MRFDMAARRVILKAADHARQLGHSYVGTAHLLLALGEEPGLPAMLLTGSGVNVQTVRQMAAVLYGKGSANLPLPQGFSAQMRRVLHRAGDEAKLLRDRYVRPVHLLLALLRQGKTEARDLLILSGVDSEALFTRTVEYLHWEPPAPARGNREGFTTKLLEQFSEDLIAKAATMEPVIGREKEIETVIGILSRKNKNNPALVGEPGVGKPAIAEGLAQRMAAVNVPPQLRDKRLVSLNMANLVAGTKYRGEFE